MVAGRAVSPPMESTASEPEPRRGRPRPAGRPMDIVAAFARRVAEHGYADTNYSHIAGDLGIAKGTIVHYYATKDRLFAAMHDLYLHRCLNQARAIVKRLPGPAEQLAGLLFSFILYQDVDRDFTVAFQREITTLARHERMASGRRLRADYLRVVRNVMKAGVRDGTFWSIDVDAQSLLIFGSSQWAWTWFRPDGRLSAVEAGGQLVELVLGSLLVDRSRLAELVDPSGPIARVAQECLVTITEIESAD